MSKFRPNRSLLIWPTLPLNVYFRKNTSWRPFPLNKESCRIFSKARQAVWNACKAQGLGEGDVVLVPAYHHGSEIEALLQAGVRVSYYEIDDSVEPDQAMLESLLEPAVRALYIIHYLGFPQDAARWRQWCDERDLLLIEDAAQAFLTTVNDQPVGSFGHIGLFCLYKTYGIPDGGAVISTLLPDLQNIGSTSGVWRVFKRHINWLASRYSGIGGIHLVFKPLQTSWNRLWNVMNKRIHKEFELGNPATPPSAMTMFLLPRLLDEGTAENRRRNYSFLLNHLSDMVPRPFASLPDGACPFAFPLEVSNPREFLQRLRHRGVRGLLFWFNPHPSLPVADFPKSRAFRERVLALPVHQELTVSDLHQIVKAVQESSIELTPELSIQNDYVSQ